MAALHQKEIYNHSEKLSNLKQFINQYNWDEIDYVVLEMILADLKNIVLT